MNLEETVNRAKENFEKLNLSKDNVTKIFNFIDTVATEFEDEHNFNWPVIYLLPNFVELSLESGWSVSEDLIMKAFDLFEANYHSEYNVENIDLALDNALNLSMSDESQKLLEKTIGTLALYDGKSGIGTVAKFIGEQAGASLRSEEQDYFDTLLDLFAKPEFIKVFSRFHNFEELNFNINEMIMDNLHINTSFIIPYNWHYNTDLVDVLSSDKIEALMNSQYVELNKLIPGFIVDFANFVPTCINNFVNLASEYHHHAEKHQELFYHAVNEISNVVNENNGLRKGREIFEVIFDEEVLSKLENISNLYPLGNIPKYVASIAVDVKDLNVVRDVVNLSADYSREKKSPHFLLSTISETATVTKNYKDAKRVCDLGRFYLGKEDADFAFNFISYGLREGKWNISIGSEEKGVIDAVTKGLMKFENGVIDDNIKEALNDVNSGFHDKEALSMAFDVLALYQNYDSLDIACGVIRETWQLGSYTFKEVTKCLTQYYDHNEKDNVLVELHGLAEIAGLSSNVVTARTNSLQHPAVVEDIGRYDQKNNIFSVLDHVKSIHEVDKDNLKSLMRNISERSEEYNNVKHRRDMQRFYIGFYLNVDDKEVADNFSLREMKHLFGVYDLIKSTSERWEDEAKDAAKTGFFQTLNSKLTYGSDLQSKKAILQEWCYNVSRSVIDNAADLRYTWPDSSLVQHLSEVNVV